MTDPSYRSVSTHTPADESFGEMMAEQLQRAPWLMLSLVMHGLVVLLVLLMPQSEVIQEEAVFVMLRPELEPEPIDPDPPEPEKVEPELVLDEDVIIDPVEVTEDTLVTEDPSDFADASEADSASESVSWKSPVGLAGGASSSGVYSNRGRTCGRGGGGGKAVNRSIELALEWLKNHQDEDGGWNADEFMRHDIEGLPCDGAGNAVHDVGLTGLALLAFLGDGSTMNGGVYKSVIKKGVLWLREQQDEETGLFGTRSSHDYIYNHAIAAYAMVEACGLSHSKLLRKNAEAGIEYLESHRNPYGVWRYQPRDNDQDTSITGWCVMAYKSAKDFGFAVNTEALVLADGFFDQMTDPVTGRTGYLDRGGRSSRKSGDHRVRFPAEKSECMTAVSLLCRFFLQHTPKQDPLMRKQADLILATPPVWDPADGSIDHYAWYYATYALFQMGGKHWSQWSKKIESAVVKPQRLDGNFRGSWDPAGAWGEDGGRVYSTAILCLTLEAHYRYSRLVR